MSEEATHLPPDNEFSKLRHIYLEVINSSLGEEDKRFLQRALELKLDTIKSKIDYSVHLGSRRKV